MQTMKTKSSSMSALLIKSTIKAAASEKEVGRDDKHVPVSNDVSGLETRF